MKEFFSAEKLSALPRYKRSAKATVIFFAVLTIAALICTMSISYLNVPTCDDMTFGTAGIHSIQTAFSSALRQGNGRLLGNLLGFLVEYRTLMTAGRAVVWTGIIVLSVCFAQTESLFLNCLIAAVLIFPGDDLFAQNYNWNAGFWNYTAPVFVLMLALILTDRSCKMRRRGMLLFLPACALALAGQFFSENTCVAFLGLAAALCVLHRKDRRALTRYLALLAVGAAGAVVMYTFPHVFGFAETIEGYRRTAFSAGTFSAVLTSSGRVIVRSFCRYSILLIPLSAAMLIQLKDLREQGAFRRTAALLRFVFAAVPVFSVIYNLTYKYGMSFPRWYLRFGLDAVFFAYMAAVFAVVITSVRRNGFDLKTALFIGAVAAVAPLFVVSPIGARTFYIPYLLLFLYAVLVIRDSSLVKTLERPAAVAAGFALALSCVCLLNFALRDNRYVYSARLRVLEDAMQSQSETIELPKLPNDNLAQEDTNRTAWQIFLKSNYGEEREILFLPWDEWKQRN